MAVHSQRLVDYIRLHSGAKGAIRYGYARNEQEALAAIDTWLRRRFAFVHAR